ncbi:MAG: Fe-S cluster assembly ATPase SufC [Candidatus Woesearchaeota archaeon]
MNILELKNLRIRIEGKEVIKGINLDIPRGQIAVIMGPNGSGKSTLANGLMGHPSYSITGDIILDGKNISASKPDERSRNGLFLSFQYPLEIPGVTVSNFLRTAINARREKKDHIKMIEFMKLLHHNMDMLNIPREFASRYLNEGFSGGEKKKMEILQLAMLNPKIAILDETDSGLDIDALRKVCESINILKEQNPGLTLLIITHYQRMLDYIKPDKVCILLDGKITKCGGAELALELEKEGYGEKK